MSSQKTLEAQVNLVMYVRWQWQRKTVTRSGRAASTMLNNAKNMRTMVALKQPSGRTDRLVRLPTQNPKWMEPQSSHKWFSCTVATPGQHMPTSLCTALHMITAAIIKGLLVIEIGEDKYGFTASARRSGRGRGGRFGQGGGRGGGGRSRGAAYGGPFDEMNSKIGWRHCHFMLLINCSEGFDSVLTTIVKNLIAPMAAQMATRFCIKEFGYGHRRRRFKRATCRRTRARNGMSGRRKASRRSSSIMPSTNTTRKKTGILGR